MLVKDVDVDLIKSNVLVPIISLVQMGIPLAIGIVVIYDIVVDDGSLLAELSNLIGVSEPTYDAAGKVEVDYADMYDLWVLVTGVSTIMLLLSIGAFVAVMWVLNIMIRWALLGLGYPVAWLLNKTIGSTLRRSAWGDDLDAEDVGRVGPAPPLFARAFDSLPSEISEPLSTHSESNAILTLRKLRAVLGQPEGDGDAINLKSKLGEALNWQELIHTSYFEVPEFIDLIALQLGNTGFGPLKDGFASDYPARVKLDAWLKRGAQSEPDELLQPG